MGVQHQIKKIIESFRGIEKRKSDLIDKPGYFADLKNAQMRPSGALSKRKGYHTLAENVGSLGITSYRGITQSELLVMDQNVSKLTLTDVVFSTSQNKTLQISLLPDANGHLIFKVIDPNSETGNNQSINLGDGYSSTTDQADLTVAQFVTQLASLPTELSVSINITNSHPAAFIEPFGITTIQGGANPVTFKSCVAVPSTISNGDSTYSPFTAYHTKYTNGDVIQPITTSIINNVIYFGSGYDEIMKYDGSKVYRAGLPTPSAAGLSLEATTSNPTATSGNIGLEHTKVNSNDDEEYHYMVVYTHTDAQGNIIRSNQSADAKLGWQNHRHFVKVTIPMLQPGTGFDLANTKIEIYRAPKSTLDATAPAANYYLVTDGSQGTTITSTVPSGSYVNLTSSSINNNPITNNSSVASLVYLDYLADDKINNNNFISQGDYPEGRHDLPPKGSYITAHQGSLIISGNPSFPTEVNYSLPDFNTITEEIGTEYFTPANNVIVDGTVGGPITAVKSLQDSLFIFHDNTISVLTGDITTPGVQALRKDVVSTHGEIGAFSQASIQELESSLLFLADEGIHAINSKLNYPKEMSTAIKPLLTNNKLARSQAVSFFSADDDIVGFYIPTPGKDPVVYILDVKHDAWIQWDNVDMAGGVIRHQKDTYFVSKDKNMLRLQKIKKRGDESDYSDHNQAISFDAVTAWDSLGDPNVFKKFLRLKVFITDTNLDFESGQFILEVYMRRNFSSLDLGPIELDSSYLGGWSYNNWGEFTWGDHGFEGIRTKMFGKARSMALRFKNQEINKNILISGLAFEIAAPYRPEIKE
tara:strand:+ start:801 stop:3245 length:2445 start_codon:yes stop_codon:yes gene_type:complete